MDRHTLAHNYRKIEMNSLTKSTFVNYYTSNLKLTDVQDLECEVNGFYYIIY